MLGCEFSHVRRCYMKAWILSSCLLCLFTIGEASSSQNKFDPAVYEYAMEHIASHLVDGKYYVHPDSVYVTQQGIFLNIDSIIVEVEFLGKDDQGIYVLNDKVLRVAYASRGKNTILNSTLNVFRKLDGLLFHREA